MPSGGVHPIRFGSATVPKLGVLWSVLDGLDLKGSWGKSFKTPTLLQALAPPRLQLVAPVQFQNPPGSSGTTILSLAGSNPDLKPESARTMTLGFVARPGFARPLRLEFNYYNINYTGRVSGPLDPFNETFTNPFLSGFVTLNPSADEIAAAFAEAGLSPAAIGSATTGNFTSPPSAANLAAYNAGRIYAVIDGRSINLATQRVRGIDLTGTYDATVLDGKLQLATNMSWILSSKRQITLGAPIRSTAGVAFYPAEFRGRFSASWSRGGFSAYAGISRTSGVIDTNSIPSLRGSAMTTVDLTLDYTARLGAGGPVSLTLNVTNLFDRKPPLFASSPFGLDFFENYDSTNYSALGRYVNLTLTKQF